MKKLFFLLLTFLLVCVVIALLVLCRKKKLNLLGTADVVFLGFLIGQACGRWGNFVNGEAYGTVTDLPWGMSINGRAPVHPTFFYESLWNILGFIIADFLYRKKRLYDGFIMQFVFAWYGFGRMFIEVLRSDSLYICSYHAWFTKISVLVGFAFFVGCTAWIIYNIVSIKKGKQLPLTPIVEAKAEVASEGEEQ